MPNCFKKNDNFEEMYGQRVDWYFHVEDLDYFMRDVVDDNWWFRDTYDEEADDNYANRAMVGIEVWNDIIDGNYGSAGWKWFAGQWTDPINLLVFAKGVLLIPNMPRVNSSKGSLKITAKKPSVSEKRAANHLASKGYNVELRDPSGARSKYGSTSDIVANGESWDVYTPRTSNPTRILGGMEKRHNQCQNIIVDLSETTVKVNQLGDVSARLKGKGVSFKQIIFIGDQ